MLCWITPYLRHVRCRNVRGQAPGCKPAHLYLKQLKQHSSFQIAKLCWTHAFTKHQGKAIDPCALHVRPVSRRGNHPATCHCHTGWVVAWAKRQRSPAHTQRLDGSCEHHHHHQAELDTGGRDPLCLSRPVVRDPQMSRLSAPFPSTGMHFQPGKATGMVRRPLSGRVRIHLFNRQPCQLGLPNDPPFRPVAARTAECTWACVVRLVCTFG